MADYWKSQPRKRCDFCDCWIADNKPSIDFHERGKRHKENVEKRISELRKQGQEQYKQQQALADTMAQIEADAMKKFQQDIANDPALSAKYKAMQEKADALKAAAAKKEENSKPSSASTSSKDEAKQADEHQPVWYEGTTDDGHVYYWNSQTQESRWEKPADFDGVSTYTNQQHAETSGSDTKKEKEENTSTKDKEEETSQTEDDKTEDFADRRPEKRKANSAYGTWTTVEKVEYEPVDLELPENRNCYQQYVPSAAEHLPREKLKFKEKTVSSLGGSSSESTNVGFKKRKFGGNVRKRDTSA